jgi:hypothetical protein
MDIYYGNCQKKITQMETQYKLRNLGNLHLKVQG